MKRNYLYFIGTIILLCLFVVSCSQLEEKIVASKPISPTGNYVMYGGPFTTVQVNSDTSAWVSFGVSSTCSTVTGNHILFTQGYETTVLVISPDGKAVNYEYNGQVIPHYGTKVEDAALWSTLRIYFDAKFAESTAGFQKYLLSHPEDAFVRISLADCLLQLGKYPEVKMELEKVSNNSELQSNPVLKNCYGLLQYCLTGREESAKGLNACDGYDEALKLLKHPTNNESEIWKIEYYRIPLDAKEREIVPEYLSENMPSIQKFLNLPEKSEFYNSTASFSLIRRNFLQYQILAKAIDLYGRLLAEDGKIKESVDVYRRIIRMGQQMMSGPLIYQLVGVAIRAIGENGMSLLYTEGKINNVDDAQLALNIITQLHHSDPISTFDTLMALEPGIGVMVRYEPPLTRAEVVESKLIILQTTAAVRFYQLKEGKMPQTLQDLVPTYLSEIPVDTFAKNPIGYHPNSNITLYSYGPDTTDDGGQIIYDPTNGTISKGDLVFP